MFAANLLNGFKNTVVFITLVLVIIIPATNGAGFNI
jgi:hypothetical protein